MLTLQTLRHTPYKEEDGGNQLEPHLDCELRRGGYGRVVRIAMLQEHDEKHRG